MVSLGETITIRASKFQTRYQTGDGRFAICAFTAKPAEKDKLPDGLRMYGTTAMFLASGRIPESDKGVQFALTGAWAKNKRGAGKKGEENLIERPRISDVADNILETLCDAMIAFALKGRNGVLALRAVKFALTALADDLPLGIAGRLIDGHAAHLQLAEVGGFHHSVPFVNHLVFSREDFIHRRGRS